MCHRNSLAAAQTEVPRFIVGAAIVQAAYNLYHDAVWFSKGYPLGLVALDTVLIGTLFVIYVRAWRNSRGVGDTL